MLVHLQEVSKSYGSETVLEGVTLQIEHRDRVGLVGPNGCGKTTLVKLIKGQLEADHGHVTTRSGLTLASIPQVPELSGDTTVVEETLSVFRSLRETERELGRLRERLSEAKEGENLGLSEHYADLQTHFEHLGGYDYPARTEAVLMGIGFSRQQLHQPCGTLSGGQVRRLVLAQALLKPAQLILLDEPTNHLDLQGTMWLVDYLTSLSVAFMVVSHDRYLLDEVTNRTFEILNRRLTIYPGNFSKAGRLRSQRLVEQKKQYRKQQEWKQRNEEFIRRNLFGQKTRQAQDRRKKLAKTKWIQPPAALTEQPVISVSAARAPCRVYLEMEKTSVGFPATTLLQGLNLTVLKGERIAILGSNGSGKTTLARVIAGDLQPLDGQVRLGSGVVSRFLRQDPRFDEDDSTVLDVLRSLDGSRRDEELRSYLAGFQFRGDDVFKSLGGLSGGERNRLALARLFYRPADLLILDEPTNHLDIYTRDALVSALAGFPGSMILISHDIHLIRSVARRYFLVADKGLRELPGLDALWGGDKPARPGKARRKLGGSASQTTQSQSISKNELRRLVSEVESLEAEISALEARQQERVIALSEQSEFSRAQDLARRHQQTAARLETLYRRWEEKSARLQSAD